MPDRGGHRGLRRRVARGLRAVAGHGGALFAALVGARLLTKVLVEQQMLEWSGAMTTLERRNLLEHEVLEVPGMRVVSRIPRFPRGPVHVFIPGIASGALATAHRFRTAGAWQRT